LNQYPDDLFPLLDADNQPTALLDRTELQKFLGSNCKPKLYPPTLVHAEQTMQEVEYLLVEASTNTLVLVTKDNRYLGLFSQQDSFRSQAKEEVLANS
jgi:CBS-domain-containing membrane protein